MLSFLRKKWEQLIDFLEVVVDHWRLIVVFLFFVGITYSLYRWVSIFEADKINAAEIRFYVVIFLLLCLIMCFATLRLYNAITVNTRYMKFMQDMYKKIFTKLSEFSHSITHQRNLFRSNLATFLSGLDALVSKMKNKKDGK